MPTTNPKRTEPPATTAPAPRTLAELLDAMSIGERIVIRADDFARLVGVPIDPQLTLF